MREPGGPTRPTPESGPAPAAMLDHVGDIGRRLQTGDLDPEKAGGALQYLADRLREALIDESP